MANRRRTCKNFKTCQGTITRHSKTGLCVPCSYEAQRAERSVDRGACRKCGSPLARGTRGDTCRKCPRPGATETMTVSGDRAELTVERRENPRTLADLIRVCEIDTTEWEVERWVANKWEVAMAPKTTGSSKNWTRTSSEPIHAPLYQIKAWLKRKTALITAREEIEALKADAMRQIAPRKPITTRVPGPNMLELSIPDLHLGKLAWSKETGHANYDLKIAERLFLQAVDALLSRVRAFSFDRILLPIGNDLLHSDTKAGMTFGGTILDTDSRYYKAFGVARRIITQAIDRLREIAPVDVVVVQGNHDTMSAWHLGDSLECYYHSTPDVSINNDPLPRKYVSHGKVALMFTHGDKAKSVDWPLLFATEAADIFGKAKWREVHAGHLHQTRLIEKNGVRVRICPALCSADAWHSDHGFVGAWRGAEAYVWSKNEGLVTTAFFNVRD